MPESFEYDIDADFIEIGRNVIIEPGVTISGIGGRARRIKIGDNVRLGANTKIRIPELEIGDYTQIHDHALIYGYEKVQIGHNGWFGNNVILNSTAALTIGDNCCVSAYSQLWTHFQFGDTLEGCRFNSRQALTLESDVWISTHCVISPIHAEAKSMALPGSIVTSDMKFNRVYGGNPAQDLTHKVGPQFSDISIDKKIEAFTIRLNEFFSKNQDIDRDSIGITAGDSIVKTGQIMFDLSRRTYTKQQTPEEIRFMRYLLPHIKFTPAVK